MPIQNDFLTFAAGSGANVLTQSAYAAATETATGYVSGVAPSNAFNKTWRQSSIMAAVMAQFIADETGEDVIDDGTTATIEANFIAAILAVAQMINITIPDVDGLTLALAGKLSTTGTAASATKLATSRSFNLTGPVTATAVGFDGTGNVTFSTAIADAALSIAKTSGLQSTLDSKANLSGADFTGPISSLGNVTLKYASGPTPNKHIRSDGTNLRITNSADSVYILTLTDAGNLSVPGTITGGAGTLSSLAASGAISGATVSASGVITAAGGFQVG